MSKQVTLGFIGFGNMAGAMAEGFLRKKVLPPDAIYACAKRWGKLEGRAKSLGIHPCRSPEETAEHSDIVIAAVKPYLMEEVLSPIRDKLAGKLLLSVASGWDFDRLEALVGENVPHLSLIPNTPVSVNQGVLLLEEKHSLSGEEYQLTIELLSSLGAVQTIPASQMSIASTIAGCGPAYAAMFLEALGDAGVQHGLSRELSYRLAAQMLAGTGMLQLETGAHPGAMKDAVCSPGGTTILGVAALERGGFRGTVIDAIGEVQKKR